MIGVLRLPAEVRFGPGVRAGAPAAIAGLGGRVFIVADPFLATTGAFIELTAALREAGAEVLVHTEVPPELPVDSVEASGLLARDFAPDVVVGYGGGSALDAAKLIAVIAAHGPGLAQWYGEHAVPGPVVPIVAIPTTAGTGSEVTPVAVIADPSRALKVGVSSPHLVPTLAFVDPELTVGAPRGVTVYSGIDAFVHAVESFTAATLASDAGRPWPVFVGRNALTAPLSLEAAKLIFHALPAVVADPADLDARSEMARGSLLAGIAFGSTGTHLSHAIQYPVGAMTHTPHGMGTGALLPYVLQAMVSHIAPSLVELGVAMGVLAADDGREPRVQAQDVVDAVADLCATVGLPVALTEIGVTDGDVDRIVELTLEVRRLVAISPVPANAALVRRIVTAAVAGDRRRLQTSTEEPRP